MSGRISSPDSRENRASGALPQVARRRVGKRVARREGHSKESPVASAPADRKVTKRWIRFATIVLLTTGVLAGSWLGMQWWAGVSAQRILTELASESADKIELRVGKLRLLGDQGRKALVQALVHERMEVQVAARQTLLEEIDSWKILDDRESSERVAILASRLVEVLPETNSGSRRFMSNLATDLLLWPVDGAAIDSTQLIQDCEALLRAGFQGNDDSQFDQELSSIADRASQPPATEPQVADNNAASPAIDPWELTELAGRGLAPEPSELPYLAQDLEPAPLVIGSVEPHPLPLPAEPSRETRQPLPVAELPTPNFDSVPAVEMLAEEWLTHAPHFELFKRLHLSDSLDEQRVLDELHHRGFTDEMIELGRGLADVDPAIRLATVERLRRGVRFDSLAWLRQASKDDDLQVRRSALQGLVETRDPIESRLARRKLDELNGRVLR